MTAEHGQKIIDVGRKTFASIKLCVHCGEYQAKLPRFIIAKYYNMFFKT
jgi:hypothetical protein